MKSLRLLVLLFAVACSGGPSFYVEGVPDVGARVEIDPTPFSPGARIEGIQKFVRIPAGASTAEVSKLIKEIEDVPNVPEE